MNDNYIIKQMSCFNLLSISIVIIVSDIQGIFMFITEMMGT